MIGVLVVTLQRVAEELIKNSELITGKKTQMKFMCANPDSSKEQILKEILPIIESIDTGNGILVLTDIPGTLPSRMLLEIRNNSLRVGKPFEIIWGVNLPMAIAAARGLLKAENDLQNLTQMVKEKAINAIIDSEEFPGS